MGFNPNVILVLGVVVMAIYVITLIPRYQKEKRQKIEKLASLQSDEPVRLEPRLPKALAQKPPPAAEGAPTDPDVGEGAPTGGAYYTVAEVLAGIRLPAELAPLLNTAPRPHNRDRVVFSSPLPAEVVQSGLADAIAELGATLEWLDTHHGVVHRDGRRIELEVVDNPQAANIDEAPAYPTAAAGSTVVDFWVPLNP